MMSRRNNAGRPSDLEKENHKKSTLNRVYELLPPDGTPIFKTDLRAEALNPSKKGKKGMGLNTFYETLNMLEQTGQILQDIDRSSGRPKQSYRRLLDTFYPAGKEFYGGFVLGAEHYFKQGLLREKNQWPMQNSESFLIGSFWGVIHLLGRVLVEASRMETPEAVNDYVDVVLNIHLLPWIQGLAKASQATTLVSHNFMFNVLEYFEGVPAPLEKIIDAMIDTFEAKVLKTANILGIPTEGTHPAQLAEELFTRDLIAKIIMGGIAEQLGVKVKGKSVEQVTQELEELFQKVRKNTINQEKVDREIGDSFSDWIQNEALKGIWLIEEAKKLGIKSKGKPLNQIEQEIGQKMIESVNPLGIIIKGEGKELKQIAQEIGQKMTELATQLGIKIEGKDLVQLSKEVEAQLKKEDQAE